MKYFVDARAKRGGYGTEEHPFKTIQAAADVAVPGDEILVAPGVYHENVNPKRGGSDDAHRIVYRSLEPLGAVITGAERAQSWEPFEGNVWRMTVSNGIFGGYNPYTTVISGDWYDAKRVLHTGEVYLNGNAMYEVDTLEQVKNPEQLTASWEPEETIYQWYTEQEGDFTVLYANFQGKNPNEENVEINVRRNCFYPTEEGRGYITVSGFVIRQAATTWAPPTAYQEGMIGPHWSKGWVIENCEISHSKCCGVSLGKYLQPNNENLWTTEFVKHGTQTERDAICQAQIEGWTKEQIGSHIVRGCHIHHCGQTGIVGHLGCAFSVIEDNHIHNCNDRQEMTGAETGGIKLHAAIDVTIRRNHIHNCIRGLWLDWQAQGTRVTQNLFHDNMPPKNGTTPSNMAEDLFVEVSHGPTLIDNNIFLSEIAFRICTQGIAMVHNLVAGSFSFVSNGVDNGGKNFATPRYTPYHVPHRTEVAGFMTIQHGDARFYNNVFVQQPMVEAFEAYAKATDQEGMDKLNFVCGTMPYQDYPTAQEYFGQFNRTMVKDRALRDAYYDKMPIYTGGNVFANGAVPCNKEENFYTITEPVTLALKEEKGSLRLETNLGELLPEAKLPFVCTELLGKAFEPDERFENPDGTPIVFDKDYFEDHRGLNPLAGPFAARESWKEAL